jgi:ferredoxin--NADP+ reductase
VKPGVYAAGWLKRGATGTIGTNRLDSYAVVDLLISEFQGPVKPGPDALDKLAADRDLRLTTYDDWLSIKKMEEEAASHPAPRRKFSTVEEMLDALDSPD